MSELDYIWILFCAGLVFFMQAGFMCVEAGITRTKNNISVAIKNVSDFSFSILLYWVFGYGLMYGDSAGGFFGTTNFFFNELPSRDEYVLFIYKVMFCGTAATILSGAVAERATFRGYLAVTAITVGLIYPIFGHWAWAKDETGDWAGWLGQMGFYDFAGAGVVHALGGAVALAAIIIIGPRDGRFLKSGHPRRFNGSNLPLSMLGVLIIWVGWFGFNGGGHLAFADGVPSVLLNTFVSGSAGTLAGLLISWLVTKKPNVFYGMGGALAGLVAITGCADIVGAREALVIGTIGGAIFYGGDIWLEKQQIDDAVGAVPVHLFAGIWSLIAVGIFGSNELENGMLWQLAIQSIGIVVLLLYAGLFSFGLIYLIDRVMPLRVTQHIENIGLNVGEHGANTDLNELFEIMQRQARDRDLSVRAPQSPFTEIGQIGLYYNSVLFELEHSFNHAQAQQDQLSEALSEKDRILESVLPKRVAKRMTEGEDQIVDQVADATVVFIDLVGFMEFSSESSPKEMMTLLNDLFGRYDRIIQSYNLEKIKTIGDSYMFVGGVTNDEKDHCALAVDAALEILFETQQFGISIGRNLEVRIGVNSGPLVAGLVGDLRFVYDLWGSTVNIAARVESAGKNGKVTVSEAVLQRLGTDFLYERQGRVRLKGVGPAVLYNIVGRRKSMD